MMQDIAIHTPFIKLDGLLKFAGIVPDGAAAKELIWSGCVRVDGTVEQQRGKKIYPGTVVTVLLDGQEQQIQVSAQQ